MCVCVCVYVCVCACVCLTADVRVIYVHDLLKILGKFRIKCPLHLFLVTYLGLYSLALPVFGSFRYLTLTLACKHH